MPLTAGTTDEINGGAGADTISANHLTIQNTDIINGGEGTDTLTILNTGAALSIAPAILTSVENIQVTSSSGATSSAVNLVAATGVEKVISKNSVVADSFTNLQTLAAVEIDGSSSDVTVSYKNSLLSGTADSLSLTVKGGSDLGTVTLEGATATNVVETLNLVSSGADANAVDSIVSNSAAVGTINVTGSADLTLGTGTAFGSGDVLINKLDASAFTGNLTAYIDENSGKAYSVIGGSGDDTIYLDGVDAFYNADNGNGAGNKVTSIVGGDGNDTLVIDGSLIASQLVTTTADTADNVLSGVETISSVSSGAGGTAGTADVTVDASVSADVEAVTMSLTNSTASGSTANVYTGEITNIKSQTVSATGAAGSHATAEVDVEFTKYDGSGEADSQAVTLAGLFKTVTFNDAADDAATADVTETGGVEAVAITTGAANLAVDSLVAAKAFGVTLSGAKNVTISAANLGATDTTNEATTDDVVTINAAALTGNLDLTKSEAGVYSITTGAGTNAIRLGEVADNTTVTGGTGTDTVYITDTATSSVTVDVTTTGVEAIEITTVSSGDDVFNMNGVSSGTTVKMKSGYAAALSNINGQVIEVVTAEAASADRTDSTGDTTWASTVLTAGLKSGVAGATFKISGDAEASDASTYGGTIKTSGVATINNATAASNYSLDLTVDLDGTSSSAKLTGLVLTGGGAKTASANSTITVATNDSNVDLTSLDATGYTGDVIASSMNFDSATSAATVRLAATQNITLAAAELYRDQLSIVGGSGANTVIATGVGASGTSALRPAMSGVETLDLTLVNTSDIDSSVELRDATSVTTVKLAVAETATASIAQAYASDIEIANLANNGTIQLNATSSGATTYGYNGGGTAANAEGILVSSAITGATVLNVNNLGAAAEVTVAGAAGYGGLALGSTYTTLNVDGVTTSALTFDRVAGSGLITVNLENNTTASSGTLTVTELEATALTTLTIDSTKGDVTVSDLNTMNSLETLTVNTGVAASGGKTTISAGTSTSIDTITASGTGDFQITALTASSLDSIDAAGVTGVVTLGSSSAALTVASGAEFTTGEGNDVIYLGVANLHAANAGEKESDNDTLHIKGAMNSGAIVVDLSASGDQVATFNGAANAAVQTGFESVDLSAITSTGSYGATITANAAGSSITGTGYNDVVYGGAGADTITSTAGSDTVTFGGGADIFAISTNLGTTTFVDYVNGTDKISIQGLAAITVAKADGAGTAGIQAIAYATTGATAVDVGGTSQGNVAFIKGTAAQTDGASDIDSAFAASGASLVNLASTDSAVIIFAGADNSQTINVFKAVHDATDSGGNLTAVTLIGTIVLNTGDIDDLAASGLII